MITSNEIALVQASFPRIAATEVAADLVGQGVRDRCRHHAGGRRGSRRAARRRV